MLWWLLQLFHLGRIDSKPEICQYLEDILMRNFFPQIEDVVIQRFHEAVNGTWLVFPVHCIHSRLAADSFRIEKIHRFERPLLRVRPFYILCILTVQCVVSLSDLITDLLLAVHRIPIRQEQCIKIMDTILEKFFDKCITKYRGKELRCFYWLNKWCSCDC